MKRIFLLSICLLFVGACVRAADISIIPQPASVATCEGLYYLSGGMPIVADEFFSGAVDALRRVLPPADPTAGDSPGDGFVFERVEDPHLGAEGYVLDVSPQVIRIKAAEPAGAFYAVQTFRQLAAQGRAFATVPCMVVKDSPRFPWRGLMLDVSRHFQPKEEVFRFIDTMALFKMNRLHMHLTDDQGWRLEIDAYPQLTKVGSKRAASTKFDFCMSPAGEAEEGFYTKDDMREIIAYAAKNFITVVPEIELPGHATAAIASIKGLSCLNQRFKVSNCWGVHQDVYCAGEDKVFAFLETVLAEVADLFPGPYIHIGGDEVPKDRWRACPKCRARIKAEGLKDEDQLQSWFVSRIETYVNSLGKQIIGWDEILEGGLPPRATVMSWRGMAGGTTAAREGHDVIMSPTSHCYYDYRQSDKAGEPGAGSVITLEKTYGFEPVPEDLPVDAQKHILGTQGNLWAEHIPDEQRLEYMAFPRALALAEVAWSPKPARDWNSFSKRLPAALALLKANNMNFREPAPGELAQ